MASSSALTTPEFMWCQRSDRLYVTIKVADCAKPSVHIADDVLKFRGVGHGMCGTREDGFELALAGGVDETRCRWFVCGPSVRVLLQKAEPGPYWDALLRAKLVQCKVDWQSWIDEDEETEMMEAPNGFDVDEMQTMMVGESDEFYLDPDRFSSSEEEGEEANTIQLDDGMNDVDQIQKKFAQFDVEKKERAKTQAARRDLRRRTRAAQLAQRERERDLQYGRPPRELSAEELRLLDGAATLRQRLKEEKEAEFAWWQKQDHHVMRPAQGTPQEQWAKAETVPPTKEAEDRLHQERMKEAEEQFAADHQARMKARRGRVRRRATTPPRRGDGRGGGAGGGRRGGRGRGRAGPLPRGERRRRRRQRGLERALARGECAVGRWRARRPLVGLGLRNNSECV